MPNQRTRGACPDFGRREGALTSIGRYAAVVAIVAMGMLGACAGPRHVAGTTAQEAAVNRAQTVRGRSESTSDLSDKRGMRDHRRIESRGDDG